MEMAAHCLSSSQFSRLFRETLGLSPFQNLKQKRIERAVELLRGSTPLAHIAHELGYSSQSHFTQVFREVTGVTPRMARAQR
ncbi:MAG: helix-turn-helix transcriptional regulator [Pigmentiphaga sp.]|uniref:helix-turn-helix transcriptional regulator n=1 Tax=Pigmentiphaga sp. TaxID=1977564 RepID=UPI003B55D7A3